MGNDAYGTMQRVVREGFTSSDAVVIATFDGYWDALSASALAGKLGAPVLLTASDALSPACEAEIDRLDAKRAYIVGGTAAIGKDVQTAVERKGLSVKRLAGADAMGTAEAIATEISSASSDTCIIATAGGYWDALSASPYAYATTSPIYLTGFDGVLSARTLGKIKAGGFKHAIIAGGPAAVDAGTEKQLAGIGIADVKRNAGANAYGTSISMAKWALGQGMSASGIGVATAGGYWDALCGAALCGKNNAVMVLADEGHAEAIGQVVAPNKTTMAKGYVFGGTAAVAANVLEECERATS